MKLTVKRTNATIYFTYNPATKVWSAEATTKDDVKFSNSDVTKELMSMLKHSDPRRAADYVDFHIHNDSITVGDNSLRIQFYDKSVYRTSIDSNQMNQHIKKTFPYDNSRYHFITGTIFLYTQDMIIPDYIGEEGSTAGGPDGKPSGKSGSRSNGRRCCTIM